MKKKQREILDALVRLGGEASMRGIAAEADLDTNGVSQSIGSKALEPYVEHVPNAHGKGRWSGGDEVYRIATDENQQPVYPPAPSADQDSLF